MTNMPWVIYAARYNNELTIHVSTDPLYNGVRYIRYDKHEELKAIAEKMAGALEYCEFMMSNAGLDCLPIYNIKTEYNKYKGDINEI